MNIFWNMKPCSLVESSPSSESTLPLFGVEQGPFYLLIYLFLFTNLYFDGGRQFLHNTRVTSQKKEFSEYTKF
jgi:hypothetical protein